MGLDICLRKCADLDAAKLAEASAEEEKEALWRAVGGYNKATEEQKAAIREKSEAIDIKHGCTGEYGRHGSIEKHEQDSAIDPKHMFKVGYFRSSYNDGGIERVMRKLSLPGLGDIFQPGEDDEARPDWDAALERVTAAIDGYSAHLASDAGKYQVREVRPHFNHGVKTEQEALALFMKTLGEHPAGTGFRAFSNAHGEFDLDGEKVVALITKTYTPPAAADLIGRLLGGPAIFVVYEREKTNGEDWYLTALRIVRETIEFVIAQPDRQHFYLVWSA